MKVIDLINDLFDYRGLQPDKLPKKIRFNNNEFVFKDNSYYHENGINIMRYVDHTVDLRVEIEIIEDKEIEELKLMFPCDKFDSKIGGLVAIYNTNFGDIKQKMNEIIKGLNELKKEVKK